jgi:hypothetical protein
MTGKYTGLNYAESTRLDVFVKARSRVSNVFVGLIHRENMAMWAHARVRVSSRKSFDI